MSTPSSGDRPKDGQGHRPGFFDWLGGSPRRGDRGAATGGSVIDALRALFPRDATRDERIRNFIKETVGRDDVESRPLTPAEIDKIQARVRAERAKIADGGE